MERYINSYKMLRRATNGDFREYYMTDLEQFVTDFDVLKIVRCGECQFSSGKDGTCLCSKSGKYMKATDFCCYG